MGYKSHSIYSYRSNQYFFSQNIQSFQASAAMPILASARLIESSILLRGHPPRDLCIVEMSFRLCSLCIDCLSRGQPDVRIVVSRVVPLEDGNSITELPTIGRKFRLLNLGCDHLAESLIMCGLLIIGTWKNKGRKTCELRGKCYSPYIVEKQQEEDELTVKDAKLMLHTFK